MPGIGFPGTNDGYCSNGGRAPGRHWNGHPDGSVHYYFDCPPGERLIKFTLGFYYWSPASSAPTQSAWSP